jgi:hypothetical protein
LYSALCEQRSRDCPYVPPGIWQAFSATIQALDAIPFQVGIGPGTTLAILLDTGAFITTEVDIALSSCRWNWGLHADNAANLGVGLYGNVQPQLAPLTSGSEVASYAAMTGALATC